MSEGKEDKTGVQRGGKMEIMETSLPDGGLWVIVCLQKVTTEWFEADDR